MAINNENRTENILSNKTTAERRSLDDLLYDDLSLIFGIEEPKNESSVDETQTDETQANSQSEDVHITNVNEEAVVQNEDEVVNKNNEDDEINSDVNSEEDVEEIETKDDKNYDSALFIKLTKNTRDFSREMN